jgi:hypothetical protein
MTYTATATTRHGLQVLTSVLCRQTDGVHEYQTTVDGIYYDAAMIQSPGSQAWAKKHTADAVSYLNSALTADELALLHPDLRAHLIAQRLIGWTKGDGSSTDGYHAEDYFSGPRYLGPDEHGIEPIFGHVA